MINSRIPEYKTKGPDGMLSWFAEMSVLGLLFHPDDSPEDIMQLTDNSSMFSETECEELRSILREMFDEFGDGVYNAAYPIFMKCSGIQLDA